MRGCKPEALPDFRHARQKRQRPLRRDNINNGIRMAPAQINKQALRHHHIADPGGAYDQYLLQKRTRWKTLTLIKIRIFIREEAAVCQWNP